jgi:hypothetical protein
MDLIPFRNRNSLAATTLIAPLTLILSGFAFTLIGYSMTSNTSPPFGSTPTMVEPALLPEFILSLLFSSEEITLRSAWLHPLGLAGIALTTMGWILLLPLPGFPGDRLLSALLDPGEMEEGKATFGYFPPPFHQDPTVQKGGDLLGIQVTVAIESNPLW